MSFVHYHYQAFNILLSFTIHSLLDTFPGSFLLSFNPTTHIRIHLAIFSRCLIQCKYNIWIWDAKCARDALSITLHNSNYIVYYLSTAVLLHTLLLLRICKGVWVRLCSNWFLPCKWCRILAHLKIFPFCFIVRLSLFLSPYM